MKFLFSVLAIISWSSCSFEKNTQSDDTLLLTSTAWTRTDEENPKTFETLIIHADGTFESTEGAYNDVGTKLELAITMHGTWELGANRELITNNTEMVMNGERHSLDDPDHKYVLRITELSKEKMTGVTRNMNDAEDSGFAKTVSFTGMPL